MSGYVSRFEPDGRLTERFRFLHLNEMALFMGHWSTTTLKTHDPFDRCLSHTPLSSTGNPAELLPAQNELQPIPAPGQLDGLSNLRGRWLADYGTDRETIHRRSVKRGPGASEILTEVLLQMKQQALELPSGAVKMAREAGELFFGQKVAGMLGGGGVLLLLGGVVGVGALAYAASVGHMFGPGVGEADGGTRLAGIDVDTTKPALVQVPTTNDGVGASAEGKPLGGESGGMAPDWNGGAVDASAQVKLAEADAYPDASTSLHDVGVGGVEAAGLYTEEAKRKIADASSERLGSGARNQSAAGNESAHGRMGDRGGLAAAAPSRQGLPRSSARPARGAVVDHEKVAALERAQVMAANGTSRGDVERTALDAIGHGGTAIFEVQHVDSRTGAVRPVRILLTTTTMSFIPQARGGPSAFSIPLKLVSVEGKASDAGVMKLEFKAGEQKAQLNLRDASSKTAPLVRHVRNVIRELQRD